MDEPRVQVGLGGTAGPSPPVGTPAFCLPEVLRSSC